MYITPPSRNQRTPLVNLATPQNLWSDPAGNTHAYWREISLFRSLQLFFPRAVDGGCDFSTGEARFYFAPGERVSKKAKRSFAEYKACLRDPRKFPTCMEVEFSSPIGGSVPQAYKTSAIDWALSVCDTVLICIDRERGSAEGEAYRVLTPLQVVFRCREEDVGAWTEYLRPRLRGRHRLSVVHPQILVGRA